ncbi:MAG: cytochrome c peroxidase [Planctomycetota bacterium]
MLRSLILATIFLRLALANACTLTSAQPPKLHETTDQLRRQYARPSSQWPEPNIDEGVQWQELGLLPRVEHPETNPNHPVKQALGASLYFDPRLSGSGQIACASCHDPEMGWADGRTTGFGHNRTRLPRHTPTIRNAGLYEKLFWDGRVDSLEEQIVDVINSPDEMHSSAQLIGQLIRDNKDYRGGIYSIYRDSLDLETIEQVNELPDDQILKCVSDIIACFERSIIGGQSRFDQFLIGQSETLTDSEIRGLDLFRRKGRCMNCHHGPLMSDGKFHSLGLMRMEPRGADPGRYNATKELNDLGKFRTPSLRDVSRTAPYMHNGRFTLSAVIGFYNRGMLDPLPLRIADKRVQPKKSPLLKPLGLSQIEMDDLEAFLRSLEEPWSRIETPVYPELSIE